MSLADVASRIAAIQARTVALTGAPAVRTAGTSSGTDFATALGAELGSGDSSTSSLDGASGGLSGALAGVLAGSGGTGVEAATIPTRRGSPDGDDIAAWASKYVGVPYVAGGRSPHGWDCAGFTQWAYKQFGVRIPEVSWQQVKQGSPVAGLTEAKPGDLLFFHEPGGHRRDPSPLKINHVGIYLGHGRMVEAANPRAGTRIGPVDTAHLVRIRRVLPSGDGIHRSPSQVRAVSSVAAGAAIAPAASVSPSAPLALDSKGRLGAHQLVDVLRRAGFTGEGLRTAWALAMRESGGRPGALSKVNGDGTRDHGLFQLNSIHVGRVIPADKVFDAEANARAAYKLSHHGSNFSAWGIGHTGWAGHLERTQPATYAAYNKRFQELLATYPG
ncbi:MAG: NlpC/P60 family protein [Candidatus Nanopelagicales bacterium]